MIFFYFFEQTGNDLDTSLWHDKLVGNLTLKNKYPHLYALKSEKRCKVKDRLFVGTYEPICSGHHHCALLNQSESFCQQTCSPSIKFRIYSVRHVDGPTEQLVQ